MEEIPENVINGLKENAAREAGGVLEETAKIMRDGGVEFKQEVAQGAPGKILSNLAKTKDYDLIIMGSHGHSDIAGLFLGSVTHKVLNTIYCPVLVVP
jgi:nucleotide-binding universal stress UspA family protein